MTERIIPDDISAKMSAYKDAIKPIQKILKAQLELRAGPMIIYDIKTGEVLMSPQALGNVEKLCSQMMRTIFDNFFPTESNDRQAKDCQAQG